MKTGKTSPPPETRPRRRSAKSSPRPLPGPQVRRDLRFSALAPQEEEAARAAFALALSTFPLWRPGVHVRDAVRVAGAGLSRAARRALTNELCALYAPGPQASGRAQFDRRGPGYFRDLARRRWELHPVYRLRNPPPKPALSAGERAGRATLKARGLRHYRRMGKLSGAARRAKKATTTKTKGNKTP